MCAPERRDAGSAHLAKEVSGGSVKWGARRAWVCASAASPFLPERVCNLTFPSALSQPDASFLVFLRVYCKFRA